MQGRFLAEESESVALLAEGVDRNASYAVEYDWYIQVALLAEGVDRNPR